MNFRVFLLIGAMAAFGALWSSDGRYQAEQVALARLEGARSSSAAAVLITKLKTEMVEPVWKRAVQLARDTPPAAIAPASLSLPRPRPICSDVNDSMAPNAMFSRLIVAWILNIDPGNQANLLANRVGLAKARFEERYCLLRFQTREAAFFATRRAATFLRTQLSVPEQAGRIARITIREVPIEESQAPAAGGRQMR